MFSLLLTAQLLEAAISYEVRIAQTKNGNYWDMDIEIRSTGTTTFVLSTSTFFLDYPTSPARFSTPEKVSANDGPWDAQSDADYANVSLASGTGYLGLAVEFAGGEDDNGQVVPSSWTRIGTLRLTITDQTKTSGLSWRLIGTVTQVFRLTNPGVSGGGSTDITSLGTFISPDDSPLPVELTSFTALAQGNNVVLNWTTATEVNNYGFEVERAAVNNQPLIKSWAKIGFVEGHGNSNSPKEYSFTDLNPPSGKVKYSLKQIDFDGKFEYSQIVEITLETPVNFSVQQNYPNPFNPTTKISFSIPVQSFITLKVFDILGREIETLVNELKQPGYYDIEFDSRKLTSGVYIYQIQAGSFRDIKKMLLIR